MNDQHSKADNVIGAVMVVGAGIGGIQASLDLAESGFKVYLVESSPTIGGVMAQLDKTFPTNDCSMCILSPKLVECGRHLNIEVMTCSEMVDVSGSIGNFQVKVRKKARYVDETLCTGCGECVAECPVQVDSEFDQGLVRRKAIYRPFPQGVPNVFAIDKKETPPCKAACPLHMDVQGYVALIRERKFEEAYRLIRRTNPLPAVCGRVCYHPCEEECKRGRIDEPLAIRALKRFACDQFGPPGLNAEVPQIEPNGYRIAIVGSGPAGLTAAHDLALEGYQVTIFEALPKPGGMLRVGIPEYRLPKAILDQEIAYIERLGVEIRTSTPVGDRISVADLREAHDALFLATGAPRSLKLQIPGEEAQGVIHGLDFLRRVNLGQKVEIGDRVAIIGGGNTAIDAARVTRRLGAESVAILYRRSRQEMPASKEEVEAAEAEGIELRFLVTPVRVLTEDGRVVGLECVRMRLGEPDASGRPRPTPIEGSEFTIELDAVIPALGQATDITFAAEMGLEVSRRGRLVVDEDTLATNVEGVFAGGDVVTGPWIAIQAMTAGRRAARAIDKYLKGEKVAVGDLAVIRPPREPTSEELEQLRSEHGLAPRVWPAQLSPVERVWDFSEVELALVAEAAQAEAARCLECGVCSECRECEKLCERGAIDHNMQDQMVEVEVGSIILAPGFEEFDARLRGEYGYGRYPNVVTSIEFERILSASGPFKGRVQRPSDGDIPTRIAFIQCVGSRDAAHGHGYCSSVCCMYATKEAVIAKEHMAQIEPTIFYMDMRAYGKDFDKYVERAKEEYGVRYIRHMVSLIREDPHTNNLLVRHEAENGRMVDEEFHLVVLSVGFEPSPGVRDLADRLGIELNGYGFCKTDPLSPLSTSRPGIFVCGAFSGPKDIPETVMQASGAAAAAGAVLSPARGTLIKKKAYPAERDIRGEPPRIGVFICFCGINIGGVVDVPQVVEYARTLPHVVYAESNLYTCSQDTQERIKETIVEHGLNRVIVASCTPRTHEPLFQETLQEAGLNRYLFEMANIRDQCSWVHMHEPQAATEKAKDLVRMAVAKAQRLETLQRQSLPVTPAGLVMGGGLSGMTAALALAEGGFEAYLVEREAELGGMLRRIHYTLEGHQVQAYLSELKERVKSTPRVHVFTEAQVEDISGYVGNFVTTLHVNGQGDQSLRHGVVIVATGAEEYRPKEYLYGEDPRVVTQSELEAMLAKGSTGLWATGNKDTSNSLLGASSPVTHPSVVMIQCVGSRNGEHPYCSRTCCSEAIKNALKIKEISPQTNVFVLYRDIRTYGFKEDSYQRAREAGVIFIRYDEGMEPQVTRQNLNGRDILWVKARDPLMGEELLIEADLVALSVATVPRTENRTLAQMLKVPLNEDGFFLEAHVKLRPVDFATEGIFVCGLAHSPKFIEESIAQAQAAASRACTILSKEMIEAEGIVPTVNIARCTACGLCEQICAYKAVEVRVVDERRGIKAAQVNEALCKGCGACAAGCRSGAIDLRGFSNEQVLAAISAFQFG